MATNVKKLCLKLLHANAENEVIAILKDAGYWDDEKAWRLYGDKSLNYSTIGNQQSRPEAALVEKIINSVDARLTNECLCAGIDPASASAPKSIKHAVAKFFESHERKGDIGGSLRNWPSKKRLDESHNITLAATGSVSMAAAANFSIDITSAIL